VGRLASSRQSAAGSGQAFEMEGVEVPRKVDGAPTVAGVSKGRSRGVRWAKDLVHGLLKLKSTRL
jgi:hypothetical protein